MAKKDTIIVDGTEITIISEKNNMDKKMKKLKLPLNDSVKIYED